MQTAMLDLIADSLVRRAPARDDEDFLSRRELQVYDYGIVQQLQTIRVITIKHALRYISPP